jgi:hypothetical protein
MQRFKDRIVFLKNKIKGYNLYWDIVYNDYQSSYNVYQIKIEKNWTKIILDTNHCVLYINEISFYVETFKFAEDIINSYVIANELTISEENQNENTLRRLKIKKILGI